LGRFCLSQMSTDRKTSPVFVMGCHRSGTNLLYDTLLSAGGFAVYRGYLPVHKILIPRFGGFERVENRKRALEAWLRSKGFRRSGLNAEELSAEVMANCENGGDFIRIVMNRIARQQNVARWAVYDPDSLLHLPRVKRDIPEALFIHIVRDGRDIALSLKKMDGFRPLPWDRHSRSLVSTGIYWAWMVSKGRQHGSRFPADYLEIHYEDLVADPKRTLSKLSEFLDQELDYDRIQGVRLGRLSESNSSFRGEEQQQSPVNRWQGRLSAAELVAIESAIRDTLREFGYVPTTPRHGSLRDLGNPARRWFYQALFETKLWLKTRTAAGRLANLSALELENPENLPGNSEPGDTAPSL